MKSAHLTRGAGKLKTQRKLAHRRRIINKLVLGDVMGNKTSCVECGTCGEPLVWIGRIPICSDCYQQSGGTIVDKSASRY
jgi:hypothetical protein